MRKKFFVVCSLILVMIILSGCLTIPLGSKGGTIEISNDGIEYIPANAVAEEEDVVEANNEDEEKEEEEEVEEEKDEEEDEEKKLSPFLQGDDEVPEEISTEESCEDIDYSELTDHIKGDFYIPECAQILYVEVNPGKVQAELYVPGVSWRQIYKEYDENLDLISRQEDWPDNVPWEERYNTIITGILNDGERISLILNDSDHGKYAMIGIGYGNF